MQVGSRDTPGSYFQSLESSSLKALPRTFVAEHDHIASPQGNCEARSPPSISPIFDPT